MGALGVPLGAQPSLPPPPQPMLSPSTGKPGSGTENCTVHVMGDATPPGKPGPNASPLPKPCPAPPLPAEGLGGWGGLTAPAPGRKSPAERLPLQTLWHVIMKQSYVCALIAMMVRAGGDTPSFHTSPGSPACERPHPASPLPGVEHHLPQLADLRAAALVLPHLDRAEPAPLRHAVLALPAALRRGALQPAVRLGHGPGPRAAHPHRLHEPGAAGAGAPQIPLPGPGG